jgi:hypothetical protein
LISVKPFGARRTPPAKRTDKQSATNVWVNVRMLFVKMSATPNTQKTPWTVHVIPTVPTDVLVHLKIRLETVTAHRLHYPMKIASKNTVTLPKTVGTIVPTVLIAVR